ncbi:MAG: DUF2249 domain-containing protein [Sulfuricurvum sp.]|nr:DUF2249 domain-containing protein [Sulfuricurvum sp.]
MILLDTRGLEHPVPLEMAFSAFTKLHGAQILHMIHTREPLPLFELVTKNEGKYYSSQDDEGIWHILMTRDESIHLESCRV